MKPQLTCLLLALSACAPHGDDNAIRTGAPDTALATVGPAAPTFRAADSTPGEAMEGTLAAFVDHEIVGIGILSYANQDLDQVILDLVRHPAFPALVNDIAVECGNSLYQPVLDRYIAGENVPLSEVRPVWRNTTQPFCGVSGFYDQLFPLVRRINQSLPADRRLRVLAGDPPVDWSRVTTRADLRPFMDRDASIASVMGQEVLAKHRKALMIFGARHLIHGGGGAVGMLERAGHRNAIYVIMAHNGFGNNSPLGVHNDEMERRLAAWPVPSMVALSHTWIGDLDGDYILSGEHHRHVSAMADAYLYLGPRDLLLKDPPAASAMLDTAYLAELDRRAKVREGQLGINALLREAADTDVFFNRTAGH
jgi:hypothetical protein